MISGALVGLDCFTRITNIVGLSLAAAILYYGYINRNKLQVQVKQVLIFLSGCILMVIAILVLMKLINHLSPFIESVGIVLHMGTDQGSEHNFKHLLFSFFRKYFLSTCYFSVVFIFGIVATLAGNVAKSKTKYNLKPLFIILQFFFLLLVCYLTIIGKIRWVMLLFFLLGFTITATVLIIAGHHDKNIKLLAFIGILILLFYPLGSDELVEMFSLWIIFPVAIDTGNQ